MNSFSKLRFSKSIFAKFTFSFIIVGLIPLLVLSYISLNTFSNYLERYAVNNFEQMLLFASKNVDDMYIRNIIIFQTNVFLWYEQRARSGETIAAQTLEGDYRLTRTVDDFLQTVLYTDRYLQSVFFVFPNGAYQTVTKQNRTFDFRYQFPDREWGEVLQQNRNLLSYFPTHLDNYYLGSDQQVLTFGRNLVNVVNAPGVEGEIVGSLYMDVSMGAFDEIFQQMMLNSKDVVYILDQNNRILYSSDRASIGQTYVQNDSKEYFRMQKDNSNVAWKIVGELYKDELVERTRKIINTITIVVGLCIVSLILVAIWFSRRF